MGTSRRVLAALAAAVGLAALHAPAMAGVLDEKIAVSGEAAPGSGAYFSDFFAPYINNAGEISFLAYNKTATGASAPAGAWMGVPLNLGLLALQNDTAPGTGTTYGFAPSMNMSTVPGEAYWVGSLSSGYGNLPQGVFRKTSDGVSAVAYSGQTAPDTGGSLYNSFSPGVPSQSGLALFWAALNNTDINHVTTTDWGLFQVNWAAGATHLVAQLGGAAPDVDSTFVGLTGTKLNAAGAVVLCGTVASSANLGQPGGPRTGGASGLYDGIWAGAPGQMRLAVRSTDAAPGFADGSAVGLILSPGVTVNNAGQIAFQSQVQVAGGTTAPTFWMRDSNGTLTPVVKAGDPLPGATQGETIASVFSGNPKLNHDGTVALTVALTGANVTGFNDRAIITGATGDLHQVARTGDPAPGLPGASFVSLDNLYINDPGDVAFTAYLTGSGITGGTYGLWCYRPGVGLTEVLRDGADVQLAPGDTRTLAPRDSHPGFTLSGGGNTEDGWGRAFNDSDQLAMQMYFQDGSTAVVRLTALVPEPATLGILAAGALLLVQRQRKSAKTSRR